MARHARVYIVDIPYHADKAYTYFIPAGMEEEVGEGSFVEVPFGRGNRRMTGVVIEAEDASDDDGIKPINTVIGGGPIMNKEQLELCVFLKEHTLCTFGDAVKTVFPSAALAKVISYFRVVPDKEDFAFPELPASAREKARMVLSVAAEKKRFSQQTLQSEFDFDCSKTVSLLLKYGYIEKYSELKFPSAGKKKKVISLSSSFREKIDTFPTALDGEMFLLRSENQRSVLSYLSKNDSVTDTELYKALEMRSDGGRRAVTALAEKGLVAVREESDIRNHFTAENILGEIGKVEHTKPALSEEQQAAADKIISLYEKNRPEGVLLHGVTGSGKTNVIMEAIDRVLADGRGVIMLVPEIALTPQTVGIFIRRYGNTIAVVHSGLSAGERYDAWRRIRDGAARVVIGTRSAIFAPIDNIGMIVIDEEHEYTYKSDTNPKFRAHEIASYRSGVHNAVTVFASATPSVTTYHKTVTGKLTLVELKSRYGKATLPEVHIYDMRGEVASGNLSPVGSLLSERLREDKKCGNQSILFLNRRGHSNYISCRSCGKSIKCQRCSVTLTYHSYKKGKADENIEDMDEYRRKNGQMVCHMCGLHIPVPDTCPECGKNHFLFMGCGTQKAEDEIVSAFPDLRVLRMDLDTTQAKYSHEQILSEFRNGDADVLLGTQMVTKGHDFPRVATVGVLNADSAFSVDDYRAEERTYAMLTQVIGRAGRADVPGVAIIQTYNPDNETILMASKQEYRKFYDSTIKLREALVFPPFCDIAVITLSSSDESYLGLAVQRMRKRIFEHLQTDYKGVVMTVYGPFEAPVYRVQNVCRMRFVFKCRLDKKTRAMISELLCEFSRSAPDKYAKLVVSTKSDSRITVTADLNPSTV